MIASVMKYARNAGIASVIAYSSSTAKNSCEKMVGSSG